MGRLARAVLIALAVIGAFYVAMMLFVSFGNVCTDEQTALVPSPSNRYVASIRVERCPKVSQPKLFVYLRYPSDPSHTHYVGDYIFAAERDAADEDASDPSVYVTWTGDNALRVSYPSGLIVSSMKERMDAIIVTFVSKETR